MKSEGIKNLNISFLFLLIVFMRRVNKLNLTELCSCIPKQIIQGSEAVQMLRMSMEACSKVHPKTVIYGPTETEEQEEQLRKAIEKEIESFASDAILWKGVYGKKPDIVQYWFFMHGILIIQGLENKWCLMRSKINLKEWKKLKVN